MVDWQITATNIYCDSVDDYVTIVVYKDGTAKCTGYKRYTEKPTKEIDKMLKKKNRKLCRELRCEGPLDYRITYYRSKLFAEEKDRCS